MKILFCSRWFPYPPDNGSKIRIFNLLKQLSARHEVDLISFTSETLSDEQLSAVRTYCRRVYTIPYKSFQPGRSKALVGFFSRRPRSVVDTFSPEMQQLVSSVGRERSFDMVIASQTDMAPYVAGLTRLPKLFEEVELTTLYEQFFKTSHPVKKLRSGLTWWKLSNYTAKLLRAFNGCTVVSEGERKRVLQVSPGYTPIKVVPNGVDIHYYATQFGLPEADTLVYSGALTYGANFDAVDFFLREVFPLIQAERPQVKLFISGKLDGVPVDLLPHNDSVIFTGYLQDIRPRVARSWLNIVPLRLGGGTRLKVLESLALGTPVVATSKGAEGLDLVPGRDLLIANEPAEFATGVLKLLGDAALRDRLSQHGRSAVKNYDWSVIGQKFCTFVEEVVTVGASA
jgi:glycosyltransferase involved in cell wall biosynthesis